MRKRTLPILSAFLALALAAPAPAEEPAPVNLARWEGAQLRVSSVNGGREQDNEFYGAPNLADGGENFINGINYTYWLTDNASRHWIRLRLAEPAEVRSVMLEFNVAKTGSAERPGEFALDVATLGPGGETRVEKFASISADPPARAGEGYSRQGLAPLRPEDTDVPLANEEPPFFPESALSRQAFPSAPVGGFRVFYPLEEPLRRVVELTVVFPGPSMIAVSEIEVMGLPEAPPEATPRSAEE